MSGRRIPNDLQEKPKREQTLFKSIKLGEKYAYLQADIISIIQSLTTGGRYYVYLQADIISVIQSLTADDRYYLYLFVGGYIVYYLTGARNKTKAEAEISSPSRLKQRQKHRQKQARKKKFLTP